MPNIYALLLRYQVGESSPSRRQVWHPANGVWQDVDRAWTKRDWRTLLLGRTPPAPQSWVDAVEQLDTQAQRAVLSCDPSDTPQAIANRVGDNNAKSDDDDHSRWKTVLWVRHCFGCHNRSSWDFRTALWYRATGHASLCTTDGDHLEALHTTATHVFSTVDSVPNLQDVPFAYHASILPRAMMTAQLLRAVRGDTSTPIHRMWYVSEQTNVVERVPVLKTLLYYLLLLLSCCGIPWLNSRATRDLWRRQALSSNNNQSDVSFNEGLNHLSVEDSDKYVRFLNATSPNISGTISNDSPAPRGGQAAPEGSYDAPDLLQWERHVLPTLQDNRVHVIVTHGKTLKKYTQQMTATAP